MITKSIFAAAALAIATAATPIAAAEASPQINFNIGIQTPDGYLSFGTGPGYVPQPSSLSCYEAR